MKKIFRMIIFSLTALLLTSLWNKGFQIENNLYDISFAVCALLVLEYFLLPLSRIVLLPLNIITVGTASFVFYIIVIYILSTYFLFFKITPWDFPGLHFFSLTLPKMHIPYLANLVLSSFSLSGIIRLLEILI